MNCRVIALCACLVALSTSLLSAQDRSRYRSYQIGDDLRTIAQQSGAALPIAKFLLHEPAVLQELSLLQELEWRAQYFRGTPRQSDAVARVTFGFYDDQLFRIVVDYDRRRTEGMTEADMVAAISETYGPPSRRAEPTPSFAEPRSERGSDAVVARWGDNEYSVALLRVPDSSAFRLVVASTRLGSLARVAGAGAVRPYSHESPQHDIHARVSDAEDVQSCPAEEGAACQQGRLQAVTIPCKDFRSAHMNLRPLHDRVSRKHEVVSAIDLDTSSVEVTR